jgi:tight adherence protein B
MNQDTLLFLLPAITVFMLVMGVYKLFFEKQAQAKETIQELLQKTPVPSSGVSVREAVGNKSSVKQEAILKKRNKDPKSWSAKMGTKLERANLLLRPEEFVFMSIGSALAGFLGLWFLFSQGPFVGVLGGIASYFAPELYLMVRTWLRLRKADEQFADVLDALVNCFKTGYGFSRAIQMVSDNYQDPWGTEFSKMAMEMNLGSSQEDCLFNLANRVPTIDVNMFVTAMMIQKETGGNLSELLGNLSKTCRERFKLYRKIGAISAQGKLSASIVTCIPFCLMALMYLFLPEPVTKFVTNPIGIILMILAGIWMSIGIGVLYKLVQIEV